ncbi:MAG: DUF1801 domain-containing protein [Flavobacteriales bacterium]|nr:DUF1801 domain-containing protein [Flavobacteriales bacterium]
MAEIKTQKNNESVNAFIDKVEHVGRRNDALEILEMMITITKEKPKMWGTSIIGFGDVRYKYASGREGDWFKVGFSPRKANISLYLMGCDISKADSILSRLGKYKTGKGCLYINKLSDVDTDVLEELIKEGFENGHIGTEQH